MNTIDVEIAGVHFRSVCRTAAISLDRAVDRLRQATDGMIVAAQNFACAASGERPAVRPGAYSEFTARSARR